MDYIELFPKEGTVTVTKNESSPFLGSCNFFEKLLFNYQF